MLGELTSRKSYIYCLYFIANAGQINTISWGKVVRICKHEKLDYVIHSIFLIEIIKSNTKK